MNKKIAKILSVILALSLVVLTGFSAFAAVGVKTDTVQLKTLQNGDFELPEQTSDFKKKSVIMTLSDAPTAKELIYESLLRAEDSIDLTSYMISIDDFTPLYTDVINDHPDLFYVSSSITYQYSNITGCVRLIMPHYVLTGDELLGAKSIFDSGVQKALSKVDDSMTDIQKCLVLHDYLCDISSYPRLDVVGDKEIYHSAYGVFYDGNTVCAGYSLAYSYLLSMLGIQSEYVASAPMAHAWNVVKIDGNWYNVDLTYDDIGEDYDAINVNGAMLHRCFMKSDAALESEMGFFHNGGRCSDNISMTDTSYDDYFWNQITTNIAVVNGDYYYVKCPSANSAMYLYKRTQSGVESKQGGYGFGYSSTRFRGVYYDSDDVAHEVEYIDPHVRLVYLDNRFYICSAKNIYSYFKSGTTYKRYTILTTTDNNVFSLGCNDKNELVYRCRNESDKITLDKLEILSHNITRTGGAGYYNYVDINLDGYVNGKDFAMIRDEMKRLR